MTIDKNQIIMLRIVFPVENFSITKAKSIRITKQ